MKPESFAEHTVLVAKDQPEYLLLPALILRSEHSIDFYTCWRMTFRERLKALFTGRIWCAQMTSGQLQPQMLSVHKPFKVLDGNPVPQ